LGEASLDAEMHMVHEESATKSKAVVAVLFSTKAGTPSKLLGDVRSTLPHMMYYLHVYFFYQKKWP